jgi:phosphoribosyl 1,2-cyclic phosphodiesterase
MHWDHIQGVPFFPPIYRPGFRFDVHAPQMEGVTARDVLSTQMSYPMFPVEFGSLPSEWRFHELLPDADIDLGDGVRIETRALNHPGGSLGVRVHYRGRSVVHCSDTEHFADRFDDNVLALCRGADFVNYDASYCHDEYMGVTGPSRVGWGHSTWQEAVRVAKEAEVGTLVLFHHDHTHSDDLLDEIHVLARREFPSTIMAIEGHEVDVLTGEVRRAR